jgi:DNA-binding transcriptional regulator YhcF (GntR family)
MKRSQARIRLNISRDVPAYRQIVGQLRAFVIEGVLKPGDTLPTVRRLALELGVHFNTIAEAYRVLAQEKFVEVIHGHGARVIRRSPPPASRADVDDFRLRLREFVADVRARGVSKQEIVGELAAMIAILEA